MDAPAGLAPAAVAPAADAAQEEDEDDEDEDEFDNPDVMGHQELPAPVVAQVVAVESDSDDDEGMNFVLSLLSDCKFAN